MGAISDERIGHSWGEPSVLADQTVGQLTAHLVFGGVGIVELCLDGPLPTDGAAFTSTSEYLASVADSLTEESHAASRALSADLASQGHAAVAQNARAQVDGLRQRVSNDPVDRMITVPNRGPMRLDLFLASRLVEQAVHLDDLARSVGAEPWPYPEAAALMALTLGVEAGAKRSGFSPMIQTLFRIPAPGTLPVL